MSLAPTVVLGPDIFDAYCVCRNWDAISTTVSSIALPESILTIRGHMVDEPFGPRIELPNSQDNIKFGVIKLYELWFEPAPVARRYVRKSPDIISKPIVCIQSGISEGVINSRNPQKGSMTSQQDWTHNKNNSIREWHPAFDTILPMVEKANGGPAALSIDAGGCVLSIVSQELPLPITFNILHEMVQEKIAAPIDLVTNLRPERIATYKGHDVSKNDCLALASGLPASPGFARGLMAFPSTFQGNAVADNLILFVDNNHPDPSRMIFASQGAVALYGGMTSHAAVISRHMGKPCVIVSDMRVDKEHCLVSLGRDLFSEFSDVLIDGNSGVVKFPKPSAIDIPQFEHGNLNFLVDLVRSIMGNSSNFAIHPLWLQWAFAQIAGRLHQMSLI